MIAGSVVHAAGGVLWRRGDGGDPEVALVHRPRYDDWSMPKGKAKRDEHLLVTALREVEEETGYQPRLGPFLARFSYTPRTARVGTRKEVSYWSMAVGGGDFVPNDEVDQLEWLPLPGAAERLSYPLDRTVLNRFADLPRETAPVVVVRNGHTASGGRSSRRGLDERGRFEAAALGPILSGTGVQTLLAGPGARCVQTLTPYAEQIGVPVEIDARLGMPGELAGQPDIEAVARRLLRLTSAGVPVAVCVHGTAVAPLTGALTALVEGPSLGDAVLRKGGWWLMHLSGARLVSAERHAPMGAPSSSR